MKWMYLALSMMFVGLTILLTLRSEEPLVILSHPRVHSYYYTDGLETMRLDFLVSRVDDYRLEAEYIEQIAIRTPTGVMAVELDRIVVGDPVPIQDQTWTIIHLFVRPSIVLSDRRIDLIDATLDLSYGDGTTLSLSIGSVHYLFQSMTSTDIGLGELYATYEEVDGIETVSAIALELLNRTEEPIRIVGVDVLADDVVTNLSQLRMDVSCRDVVHVKDCLGVDEYVFNLPVAESDWTDLLYPGQTGSYYIPLLYRKTVPFHRFAVIVTYVIDGEERQYVIDDFPYMMTSSFQPAYESRYVEYVLD